MGTALITILSFLCVISVAAAVATWMAARQIANQAPPESISPKAPRPVFSTKQAVKRRPLVNDDERSYRLELEEKKKHQLS